MWQLVAGGLGLGPNSWNCLQRVDVPAQLTEVRATFSVLTACSASVMSKGRRSSGTCGSAANEPEPPCPLWPLTSIAALRDWAGVLRLSPQLTCCILLGSRVHTWAGALVGHFVWPWFRLGQRELLAEQKRWGRGIKYISLLSLLWNLDPTCQFRAANYLVWEYPEACLHLELCCLLEEGVQQGVLSRVGTLSCCTVRVPLSRQVCCTSC